MDILAAIKREERKLEKQLGKLQHQLDGIRAAAKPCIILLSAKSLGSEETHAICCWESDDYQVEKKSGGRR